MIKVTQKKNKIGGGEQNKLNEMSFVQTNNHKKKCHCCGSVTHIFNNCDIRDNMERDQWFYRTGNLHSNHQQASEKGYKQTPESYADASVSSTKTSSWSGLQISLHGNKKATKYGSDLRVMIMMDSDTTINLFENPNIISNRLKA